MKLGEWGRRFCATGVDTFQQGGGGEFREEFDLSGSDRGPAALSRSVQGG